ncbi:MAG: DegV family protein [Deltaproteobacteria bacterium]|nr:DegV family protein [Deltaproteobacteria bacterium]
MTRIPLAECLTAGYERLAAWADLLDRINVFPVPDGDTGRNLCLTLAPCRRPDRDLRRTARRVLLAARGNSGNIAAAFLHAFLQPGTEDDLPMLASRGLAAARAAVAAPRSGTMLDVLAALVRVLERDLWEDMRPLDGFLGSLLAELAAAVRDGAQELPELREAGVVDAGALGMFLFLEGVFRTLTARESSYLSLPESFPGLLEVSPFWQPGRAQGWCLDAVVETGAGAAGLQERLAALGGEVVATPGGGPAGGLVKLHLHAADPGAVRRELAALGRVVSWGEDDLARQVEAFPFPPEDGAVHLMTDAAGSLGPELAAREGITLLASYVNLADESWPETMLEPARLYEAMRQGERVSTSQASHYERQHNFRKVLELYPRVMYLAVGAAYTGNAADAARWQAEHDPAGRLVVVDSGAASGRLGIMAVALARLCRRSRDPGEVAAGLARVREEAAELLFLDTLKYLAAGGRAPKAGAWLGHKLGLRPVITPTPSGVRRLGLVGGRASQVAFAVKQLRAAGLARGRGLALLQYTDNQAWLEGEVAPRLAREFPGLELLTAPLSLTTGSHTGPGAWSLAFLPEHAEDKP